MSRIFSKALLAVMPASAVGFVVYGWVGSMLASLMLSIFPGITGLFISFVLFMVLYFRALQVVEGQRENKNSNKTNFGDNKNE